MNRDELAAAYLFVLANGWADDVTPESLVDENGRTPEDRWKAYADAMAARIFEAYQCAVGSVGP